MSLSFNERNRREWKETIKGIFNDLNMTPQNTEWYDIDFIITVLNALGRVDQLNHMLLPSGGGQDLLGAKLSVEPGCIELVDGGCPTIVKPQKLSFHFFGDENLEWAYFRLETGTLEPSGVYDDYDDEFQFEELTELYPGSYVERFYADAGYYGYDENGEKPLPREARVVTRAFKGAYVIFMKTSTYNRTPGTYDARHNKVSGEKFEKYIQDIIDYLAEKKAE